jgi:hypothetical protein
MDEELKNALNNGNGIALICCLIECPNCHNDIWVEAGQHCGFDAVLEGIVKTDCYKCLTSINLNLFNLSTQKDVKFMTISDFIDIQFKNSKQK